MTINNTQDIIDIRDIIERYEELESLKDNEDGTFNRDLTDDERVELQTLAALLDDLKGNGGDEQWCGDWYPQLLIRDSYFTPYARELLEDCGDIPRNLPHYIAIDWETTARNIRVDYTACEIAGVTYWYR